LNKLFLGITIVIFTILLSGSNHSLANISSTSPDVVKVAPPASVDIGDTESDTEILAFDEKQNFVLTKAITVDISSAGTYADVGSLTPGVIPLGTVVNSHFVHFDPLGDDANIVALTGSLVVDGEILGIIVLDAQLDSSVSELGIPGTTYEVGNGGLEFFEEFVTVKPDLRTVEVKFSANFSVDQIRIISKPSIPVGGELIPLDNVSLVLAYGLVNSWWMAPIGIGIGVGIYLVRRKI